jgi:hypothetical protein
MKQHEREFFIASIRSGKVVINKDNIRLIIKPLSLDQTLQSCEIYNESYNQAFIDGIMNEDDMNTWMRSNDLWTYEDDEKSEGFKKDLEKLKIEIYNARNDKNLRENIRVYLRIGEVQYSQHLSKKITYYQNTAEGVATAEKISWIIKNSTYYNNKLYDFQDLSLSYIVEEWQSSFLNDRIIRELARNEPWKSLWMVRENSKIKLFYNEDNIELSHNQKNLVIWSQMYDNIQESPDCPPKEVIDDDDVLDGWFIVQSKKREQEKAEQDINNSTSNEKIKNASEVYVMATTEEKVAQIHNINSPHAKGVKKQRSNILTEAGSIQHQDLPDQRLIMQMQMNRRS